MTTTPASHSVDIQRRWFRIILGVIALIGFTVRASYLTLVTSKKPLDGDAFFFYYWGATQLARGNGFISILSQTYNSPIPAAHQPPGFIVLLGGLYKIGLHDPNHLRLAMCVLGSTTIVIIGITLAKVVSRRAGLIGAAITAVYPNIWINDTFLMSETLLVFGLSIGFFGFFSYDLKPRSIWILLASTGLTIAAMVRAEILLLLPAALIPLIWSRTRHAWKEGGTHLIVAAILPLLAVGSWTVYNASRFTKPVLMSTGFGPTALAGACDVVFYGPQIGSLSIPCAGPAYVNDRRLTPSEQRAARQRFLEADRYFQEHHELPMVAWGSSKSQPSTDVDESVDSALATHLWLHYTKANLHQLPTVALAREGRLLNLWNPAQQVLIDRYNGRGAQWVVLVNQWMFWGIMLTAIFGAIRFRRAKIPLYPLVIPLALTAFITGIVFALTRYRVAADFSMVILAAAGIEWIALLTKRQSFVDSRDF